MDENERETYERDTGNHWVCGQPFCTNCKHCTLCECTCKEEDRLNNESGNLGEFSPRYPASRVELTPEVWARFCVEAGIRPPTDATN